MADPKYANLYGIAHDQPDVYETSDLPEADQPCDIFEEKSDAIERLNISALEAFNKFQGKELDATTVDFSDQINKNKTDGYNARSVNWELAGYGDKETPLQKYNRLKLEIEHLIEEIHTEHLSELTNTLSLPVDAVNQLRSKITEVKLQDKTGSHLADISHPDELQFMKLLNHLDNLTKDIKEEPEEIKNTLEIVSNVRNAAHCIFPLKPNQQMQITSRLTELEQKINKLETLIGFNTNQIVRLCNVDTNEGLINCCQWMIAKLSLLDSSQLEIVESKINNVNSRIEQLLNNQNLIVQDPEKQKKVNDLYELSNKAKEKSNLIPNIIDRMVALETMHEQSKQSMQTVSHLESLQSELFANLANNNALLNDVKENMKVNMAIITENVNFLKTKVETLLTTKK